MAWWAPLAWALAVYVAACGSSGDGGGPADVESRLCRRVASCELLPQDAGVDDCGEVLDGCTQGLDAGAREAWQSAIEACLASQDCAGFERCYLDAPGC